MKELSIEEKAKAYDDVRGRIAIRFGSNVAKEIFSEYEESEDEKIRKEIIEFFKNYSENGTWKAIPDVTKWIAWLEEQGEQNLADKAEPKFKVGDWIIKNDDSPINIDYICCKITKVENGNYMIESIYGYKGYNTFETFEKDYHLWTIQDAKDGDVLVDTYGNIGIFEKTFGNDWHSYCYLGCNGDFMYNDVGGSHDLINTYPATKEQRDQLEKAMADAGYTFDFDKKELKKIKQKPANVSKQEPIDTTDLTDFEKCFKGMCCDKNQKFVKECCVSLLELARKQIQGEPKQEWSEEDRETIDYLIDYLESELDSSYTKEDKEEFTKEIELLKSLRPQNRWKPSEEQMEALYDSIPENVKNISEREMLLNELYKDLRKVYYDKL